MFKKFINYVKESIGELKKVSWPKKEEIVMSSIIIIVFVIIMALFLGFIDIFAGLGIREVLTIN